MYKARELKFGEIVQAGDKYIGLAGVLMDIDNYQIGISSGGSGKYFRPIPEEVEEVGDVITIKPCPFCGGKPRIYKRDREPERYEIKKHDAYYYDIACTDPDCYLVDGADWHHDTTDEAIELWNFRPLKGETDGV